VAEGSLVAAGKRDDAEPLNPQPWSESDPLPNIRIGFGRVFFYFNFYCNWRIRSCRNCHSGPRSSAPELAEVRR
jgi:hypothetical protein